MATRKSARRAALDLDVAPPAPKRARRARQLPTLNLDAVPAPAGAKAPGGAQAPAAADPVDAMQEELADALTEQAVLRAENEKLRAENDELREELEEATPSEEPSQGLREAQAQRPKAPAWLANLTGHIAEFHKRNAAKREAAARSASAPAQRKPGTEARNARAAKRAARAAMHVEVTDSSDVKVEIDGFAGSIKQFLFTPKEQFHSLRAWQETCRPLALEAMEKTHAIMPNYRAKVKQEVLLQRKSTGVIRPFAFDSGGARYGGAQRHRNRLAFVLQAADIPVRLQAMFERVDDRLEHFQETYAELGSDWVFHSVSWMSLQLLRFNPAAGAGWFPLDPKGPLGAKKACLNVKSPSNKCFEYAVLAALYPATDHKDLASNYSAHEGKLDMSMFPAGQPVAADPVALEAFERANNIAITCLTVDQAAPEWSDPDLLYTSVFAAERDPIHLLLVEDERWSDVGHWVLVRSLDRLFHKPGDKNSKCVCARCHRAFYTDETMAQHRTEGTCTEQVDPLVLPKAGSGRAVAAFRDWSKTMPQPFAAYWSLTTAADPVTGEVSAAAVCAKWVSRKDGVSDALFEAAGPDCLQNLVVRLDSWARRASFLVQEHRKLNMTPADEAAFQASTTCWFCKEALPTDRSLVHRHHCHVSSAFIGAACAGCNVNAKTKYAMPVFTHDAKVGHALLLPVVAARCDNITPRDGGIMNMRVKGHTKKLPDGREVRRSLDLVFKDSTLFLQADLADLARQRGPEFTFASQPPLKARTLQLASAMERFRSDMLAATRLDPAHEASLPAATYQAALLHTRARIECFTAGQERLFQVFRDARRGGIVQSPLRYARANNPRCPGYDPAQPTSWIVHLDVNGLYPWAMTQAMPTGGFREVDASAFTRDFILGLPDDGETGYQLVIDGYVPDHLHDRLSDLPPAPCLEATAASPTTQALAGAPIVASERLVCSLRPKTRYSVHYVALKTYLQLGFELTAVHQVVAFDQSPWLRSYIEANAAARAAASTKFEGDTAKLMNNALFGSFLLDPSQFRKVRVHHKSKEEKLIKEASRPHFARDGSATILNSETVLLETPTTKAEVYRPWAVGTAVLDVGKAHMYKTWYALRVLWPTARLLYSDTDSLVVEITQQADPYAQMAARPDIFHPRTLGLLKDEAGGRCITEFVGLRSKSYSESFSDGGSQHRAAGIMGSAVALSGVAEGSASQQPLSHEQYRAALAGGAGVALVQSTVRLHDLKPALVESTHKGLSAVETKRWVLPDGVETLPLGHWRLREADDVVM